MDEELIENPTQPPSDQEPIIYIDEHDQETEPDRKICPGVKHDGNPCTRPPLRGKEFCLAHDPSKEALRKKNAQLMLKARREKKILKDTSFLPAQLNSSEDLLATVQGLIFNLIKGKIEPKVATAGFYGINAACRIHKDNQKNDAKAKLQVKFGVKGMQPVSGTIEGPIDKIKEMLE